MAIPVVVGGSRQSNRKPENPKPPDQYFELSRQLLRLAKIQSLTLINFDCRGRFFASYSRTHALAISSQTRPVRRATTDAAHVCCESSPNKSCSASVSALMIKRESNPYGKKRSQHVTGRRKWIVFAIHEQQT